MQAVECGVPFLHGWTFCGPFGFNCGVSFLQGHLGCGISGGVLVLHPERIIWWTVRVIAMLVAFTPLLPAVRSKGCSLYLFRKALLFDSELS
jgi:hypothetical protein